MLMSSQRCPRLMLSIAPVVCVAGAVSAQPVPDLYYDFEPGNVSGTTVANVGSAGNAFDGVLTTLDRSGVLNRTTGVNFAGPSAFSPTISTDAFAGVGAFQPTNFTDTAPGAEDIGTLGGPMVIPAFDLGQQFTFSAWVKLGTNPNQSASNGRNPNPSNNSSGRLMSLANNWSEFPIDGFKFFLNEFRHPVADPDNRDLRAEFGDTNGTSMIGNRTVTTDPQDNGVPLDTVPDDDMYHHVAIVLDGTDPDATGNVVTKFYADGVLFDTFVVDSAFSVDGYDADFANKILNIGAQNNANEPFFAFGQLDEVKFWASTILSDADIAALAGVGSLVGDYDTSGQVEQGDLDIVLQNWGTGTFTGDEGALVGGGPFDGTVDQNELDGVLQNWGSTAAPDFSGVNVPEPSALAGLALLGVALRSRGRRDV